MSSSIKDVARLAGVSVATVSHVINETRFVSDATRDKVLAAIGDLHYSPNILARKFKTGSRDTVGFVVPDIANGYCTEIMVDLKADVPNKKPFDLEEFRSYLSELGDSLLAVSDGEIAKVHVHTEYPGKVFLYGSQFGQLGKIKIDNMRIQHETIVDNEQEQQESVDFAVIAVASGSGVRRRAGAAGDR